MSRKRFILSPEALEDLDQFWDYIATDNAESADRVLSRLRNEIRKVAHSPGIGHFREDLAGRRLLFWSVFSYLIIYDASERPIRIVRVLHGARNVKRILRLQ
jgi:antitoxin ParD1/3/4/toxin ParE1/3/4